MLTYSADDLADFKAGFSLSSIRTASTPGEEEDAPPLDAEDPMMA